jgi:hypothetical protein
MPHPEFKLEEIKGRSCSQSWLTMKGNRVNTGRKDLNNVRLHRPHKGLGLDLFGLAYLLNQNNRPPGWFSQIQQRPGGRLFQPLPSIRGYSCLFRGQ